MEMKDSGNPQGKTIEKSFGEVLRQIRQNRNLSQESLGFMSGYHRTYISLLERGQKSPSLQTVFQLAKALKIEPSEIIKHVQFRVSQKNDGDGG
jgi:transcriptional regulator with XRE-family HTH domain